MTRIFFSKRHLLCLLLAICSCSPPQEIGSQTKLVRVADGLPRQWIVVLKQPVGAQAPHKIQTLQTRFGLAVQHVYQYALTGFSVAMSEEEAEQLAGDEAVERIFQDAVIQLDATGAQAGAVWGIDRIDQHDLPLDKTYRFGATGAGVTAYVIDTGIRITHQEFGGRALHGWNAVDKNGNADDCNGHGTHVAGTIGGKTYGVARDVRLVAVRVLDCKGSGTVSGVIAGIDWVTEQVNSHPEQLAVANMSLGGSAISALDQAVTNSISKGIVYAVAAGNDNANACNTSPARVPDAITVGATQSNDMRASFSNYGKCLDLFAPGKGIVSAWRTSDGATKTLDGTSMATPHVCGAAALYRQAYPVATPQQVRDGLVSNASKSKVQGAGVGSPSDLLYTGFLEAASDTISPTVSLSAPSGQDPLAGLVKVGVDASDDVMVAKVELFIDGKSVTVAMQVPFEYKWNTFRAGNGAHTLKAVAYDAAGNMAEDSRQVLVQNDQPDIPVANAGADQKVKVGTTVTLDGSGSSDPGGDTLTYTWTQTAGNKVLLSDVHAVNPHFLAPYTSSVVTITFALVVSDGVNTSQTDTVSIQVLNSRLFWTVEANSADTPLAFSDANPASSAISLTANGNCLSGQVEVNIQHPLALDLRVRLQYPNGQIAVLQDYGQGTKDIHSTYTLAQCMGKPLAGSWKLLVDDRAANGDSGVLQGWTLRLK